MIIENFDTSRFRYMVQSNSIFAWTDEEGNFVWGGLHIPCEALRDFIELIEEEQKYKDNDYKV